MKPSGFAIVVGSYIGIALIAAAIINALGADIRDFALLAAVLVATQIGAISWFKQAPDTDPMRVKVALAATIGLTTLVFAIVFQSITGWFEYPEILIPIMTAGGFLMPFALVGTMWKALSQAKIKSENK